MSILQEYEEIKKYIGEEKWDNIDNNDLTFINKIRKFYNDRIDCIKGWCNNCKLRMKKN